MADEALAVSIAVSAWWTVLYIQICYFGVKWNWIQMYVYELGSGC